MNNLFRIAEEAGIRVEYCSIPLNGSISTPDPDGDFVLMDYSLIEAGAAERVHLAHELGHCQTGSFYNRFSPLDVRGKHEHRADKWAIRTLIPIDRYRDALLQGYTEPWELAEYFNVTEDFIRRAAALYNGEGRG